MEPVMGCHIERWGDGIKSLGPYLHDRRCCTGNAAAGFEAKKWSIENGT
jgi:hypothetical protein